MNRTRSALFLSSGLLAAASAAAQTNVLPTSGNLGIAAENTLFFGREEAFGGADVGGADYGYIQFRNHAPEYAYWGVSGENSALIIGTQNDPNNVNSDSVVLKGSAANIFDAPLNLFTGKIGVGSNAPTAKFEVFGGALGINGGDEIELVRLWQTDANGDNLRIIGRRAVAGTGWNTADLVIHRRVDASDMGYIKFTDFDLALGSGSTEAVRIKSNGSVGIGTSSPVALLDVVKTSTSDNSYALPVGVWAGRVINRVDTPSENGLIVANRYASAVSTAFAVGTTYDSGAGFITYFKVDGIGNVGVGTINPSHKLTVNGTIRAKEVIVDTGWADYVFAEDYRLAPLSEVEAHIKAHKHLPDIPSAAEVAEKGVSMGEMQAKMMAKIEELMLHVIRQEKRIAEQAEEIRALKRLN